jgi:hypothetical protein
MCHAFFLTRRSGDWPEWGRKPAQQLANEEAWYVKW